MAPPERFLWRRSGRIVEQGCEAAPLHRRHGPTSQFAWGRNTCQLQHRGGHIDEMDRLLAQLPPRLNPGRPVDDPGRGDAPFVRPHLVAAKGRVGSGRPTGTEAEKALRRAGGGGRIVPPATHHDLRRGAIVAGKENQRVVPGAHRADLLNHAPHLPIERLHHRRIDRHFFSLKCLLLGRERLPRQRPIHLAGAEQRQRLGGGWIGGTALLFQRRKSAGDQPSLCEPLVSCLPHRIPAGPITLAVFRDQIGRRLDREMRGGEGQILKEGVALMVARMLLQRGDRMVANCAGEIEIVDVLQWSGGIIHARWIKKIVFAGAVDRERSAKTLLQCRAVDVPLARVIAAVAGACEQLREKLRPRGTAATAPSGQRRQGTGSG